MDIGSQKRVCYVVSNELVKVSCVRVRHPLEPAHGTVGLLITPVEQEPFPASTFAGEIFWTIGPF